MEIIIRRIFYIAIFFLLTGVFFVQKANAASLTSVSDTISTSRPSAAAPLSKVNGVASGDGQAQIFDNGSFFLASDSAVLLKDATNETSDVSLKVASMSANGVPSANNRIVYFTSTTGSAHHQGVALVTPVTATHQIKFTTLSTIPSGGTILINFPGAGSNTASPSATGFSFNGELATPTDVICFPTNACSGSKASNQLNSFTMTTGAIIAGGTTIYINIGCTTAAAGPCTAFASRLINPTKTAVAGTADAWRVVIQTTDTPANGSVVLDSAILRAATIESVQVQATVEPTITFTIAGIADNTTFNSVNSNCALNGGSDKTNTGITATATSVNLGLLNSGIINAAGQTLSVTTNGSGGYTITATASGHLINPATGNYFSDANGPPGSNPLTANDAPAATGIVAGTTDFGISPCGAHVTSPAYGGTGGIVFNGASASTALFTNPWNTGTSGFYATIASYGGPVSNDLTVIRYGAAISTTQPSGIYVNVISYVATATF